MTHTDKVFDLGWVSGDRFMVGSLVQGGRDQIKGKKNRNGQHHSIIIMTGVQVAALRIAVGGLIFLPVVWRFFKRVEKKDIKYVILAGLVGNGIPAFLFAFALTKVDSSIGGALNALTPLFTLLIGYVFGVIVLNLTKVAGVVIGLAGALLIILGKGNVGFTINDSYPLLVVFATFLYGANINIIKSKLYKYEAIVISALPLFCISIPGLIILLCSDFSAFAQVSPMQTYKSVGAILLLALLGNSLSLVLFNRLIQISGPVFASSVTYFIPVVAMIWGIADGEIISKTQFGGMILIILGIYWVNKKVESNSEQIN